MTVRNDRAETHIVASTDEIARRSRLSSGDTAGFSSLISTGQGAPRFPCAVAETMTDYLFHPDDANTHWAFPTSAETDAALAERAAGFADFMNASPDEIVFGPT